MTDNRFNQLFELVTKSVNGIQRLEKSQEEMRGDISELKEGQAKLDKGLQILNRTLTIMHGDLGNLRSRVEILEEEKNLSV